MALKIITADERLASANAKTTMVIFGPSGCGKTSLLKTLPAAETLCIDLEAGMKSVQDWPGDSIPVRTFADAIDIACLVGGTDREIVTTMRGKRYATSIEGTLTGLGGNLVIIDDPLKQDDAHSKAVRKRTIEWYRSTLLSRPDDKQIARIVLVMQRVHQDDLAGYLEEQGGFEILNLPAIATQTKTYELGAVDNFSKSK
jgi:energy-coupling factor transporter ATP-binding protein EcfA2